MKVKLILFFILSSYLNCENEITSITIDSGNITSLPTSGVNYFYITTDNSETSGNVYLYLEDDNFELDKSLYFCSSTSPVTLYYILNKCNFNDKHVEPYRFTTTPPKEYYYSLSYKKPSSSKLYGIFKYEGKYPTGTLKVKSSYTNYWPNPSKKEESHELTAGDIMYIIGGSMFGLIIIFNIIFCIRVKRKRKKNEAEENLGGTDPINYDDYNSEQKSPESPYPT